MSTKERQHMLNEVAWGAGYKKIQMYNNSSPYVKARWPPLEIPLKFSWLVQTDLLLITGVSLLHKVSTRVNITSIHYKFPHQIYVGFGDLQQQVK